MSGRRIPSAALRRNGKGLYVLYLVTLSKEAEMVLLGIIGTGMIFLYFLRILINKARGVKAGDHFNKYFVVICSFLSFHRYIISTLRRNRVCDYLFLSSLLPRFILVGCRSIPMIYFGGGLNDFNE